MKGPTAKEKEERSMWQKNALFVGAQLAAVAAVVGVATMSLVGDGEVVEDEEDEEEEEEDL